MNFELAVSLLRNKILVQRCGFAMTMMLATSKQLLGEYTLGFAIWALMNVAAFYIVFSRVGFRDTKLSLEQPSAAQKIQTASGA